jgi:hypothetical protein
MASTLSPARSDFLEDPWPARASVGAKNRRVALRDGRPSLGKRATRGLTMFCIGVAATLAWQSHGGTARKMIANSYPHLDWLAPQGEAHAQTAPDMVAPTAPAAHSPDAQQLEAMRLALAALRQSMAQVAADQQRMMGDIARMQAAEQDILNKISPPPPRQAAAPARKPAPLPSPQAPPER